MRKKLSYTVYNYTVFSSNWLKLDPSIVKEQSFLMQFFFLFIFFYCHFCISRCLRSQCIEAAESGIKARACFIPPLQAHGPNIQTIISTLMPGSLFPFTFSFFHLKNAYNGKLLEIWQFGGTKVQIHHHHHDLPISHPKSNCCIITTFSLRGPFRICFYAVDPLCCWLLDLQYKW